MDFSKDIQFNIGEDLELKYVIACRKKVPQVRSKEILNCIEEFIKKNRLTKIGDYINITHGMKYDVNELILDIEILASVEDLEEGIKEEGDIRIIKNFALKNALVCRFSCSPLVLGNANPYIEKYIKDNQLEAITPGYIVTKKKQEVKSPMDNMEFEIYVGLKSEYDNNL